MKLGKVIIGTVAGFAAVVLIVVGGWQLGWFAAQSGADHAAHVNRSSYGNQQTLRDQISAHIGDVDDLSTQIVENPANADQLKAQRHAFANIVCNEAEGVTGDPLPSDDANFVAKNCLDGQTSPSSEYSQK